MLCLTDTSLYIYICDITFLNSHAPAENKSDKWKESFYEELERVFDHFPQKKNSVSRY